MPSPAIQNAPTRLLHLLYHELRDETAAYSYVMSTSLFEQHLKLCARLLETAAPIQPVITFDDGHVSNVLLAAPLLASNGMKAHFFITAGWTGNKPGYMDWPQLRELHEAGHAIGAHGWSHKLLTHCDPRELDRELGDARCRLEDKLGASITTMSLPGGRSNARVLDACSQAGYTQVYTSAPKAEPLPLGATVGRLNIRGDLQPQGMAKLFAPDGDWLESLQKQHRRKDALKRLLGDRLYASLWALVNRKEADADGDDTK